MTSSVFHLARSLFIGGQPRLYQQDQVPEHFKELFILRGYRDPRSSPWQCIYSIFNATNETFNFWTHFLPFLYFLWQLLYMWPEMDFFGPEGTYTEPMFTFMICVCLFPLMSAIAHTFNAMSDEARHVCFFLDYAALSIYSLGTAIVYKNYAMPIGLLNSRYCDYYIPVAMVNAILSTIMSCQTRFMQNGLQKKLMRFVSFAWPYVWDTLPIMYRLLICDTEDCRLGGTFFHWRQFLFAFLAAFLYTSHMPERLSPGSFDIIGHSHQLFHVFSVLGTQDQIWAMLLDLRGRKEVLTPHFEFTMTPDSLLHMLTFLGINVFMIFLFALRLYRHPHPPPCDHTHPSPTGYIHREGVPLYPAAEDMKSHSLATATGFPKRPKASRHSD